MNKSAQRYTAYVGSKLRSGFKRTMRPARKKGRSGLAAHPIVRPPMPRKRKLSKHDWHAEWVLRCIRRGESVEQIAAKWRNS